MIDSKQSETKRSQPDLRQEIREKLGKLCSALDQEIVSATQEFTDWWVDHYIPGSILKPQTIPPAEQTLQQDSKEVDYPGRYLEVLRRMEMWVYGIDAPRPTQKENHDPSPDHQTAKSLSLLLIKIMKSLDLLLLQLEKEANDVLERQETTVFPLMKPYPTFTSAKPVDSKSQEAPDSLDARHPDRQGFPSAPPPVWPKKENEMEAPVNWNRTAMNEAIEQLAVSQAANERALTATDRSLQILRDFLKVNPGGETLPRHNPDASKEQPIASAASGVTA